ncbi:MAG TPA: rhodanese-like domain-containing protein [Candidatus Lumbricidophila sp.]|nr:rhodanese-like domain-containing protein [Candidatus Lumbricidophila sp.]
MTAPIISAADLEPRLGETNLVVVDATVRGVQDEAGFRWESCRAEYNEQHIPGAVYADLIHDFSNPDSGLMFGRPSVERLAAAARAIGIDDTAQVVIYDQALGQHAARLWWLLRSAGLDAVAVLDGGLNGWRAAHRPLTAEASAPRAAGALTLTERSEWWADHAEVSALSAGERPGSLVCALPPNEFRGDAGPVWRSGHITASTNLPYIALLDRDNHTFLTGADRAERTDAVGDAERTVVYCGAGLAASGTAFALVAAGKRNVAIYDGGLEEWIRSGTVLKTPKPESQLS